MNHVLSRARVDAHICTYMKSPPVTGRTDVLMRAQLESTLLPKNHQLSAERLDGSLIEAFEVFI